MKASIRLTMATLVLSLIAAAGASAQQAGSLAFIDSERLRREAPGLQEARQQLEREMGRFEAQADSTLGPLQQELQALASEFQQQQAMMTPERRQERQQAITEKQQQLQQRGAQIEQQVMARQNEILGPQLERINQVIDQIRQDRGYAIIFDVAAGGVMAADPALDITGEVLRRLNAVANGGS